MKNIGTKTKKFGAMLLYTYSKTALVQLIIISAFTVVSLLINILVKGHNSIGSIVLVVAIFASIVAYLLAIAKDNKPLIRANYSMYATPTMVYSTHWLALMTYILAIWGIFSLINLFLASVPNQLDFLYIYKNILAVYPNTAGALKVFVGIIILLPTMAITMYFSIVNNRYWGISALYIILYFIFFGDVTRTIQSEWQLLIVVLAVVLNCHIGKRAIAKGGCHE